jgi:hypothetical protein
MIDLGPVRRWRTGGILWAENDLLVGAFVIDPSRVGEMTWYDDIMVEFITPKTGRLWDDR